MDAGDDVNEQTAAFWEELYRKKDRIWSGKVNAVMAAIVGDLPAGRALDLGCGEGGDAVWLAQRGWTVTAVDVSQLALDRAAAHAQELELSTITWERHDLTATFPAGTFDLVSAQFLQSPIEFPRAEVLRTAAASVAPGGRLLSISHAAFPSWSKHAHHDVVFPTPEEEVDALDLDPGDWAVERCEVVEREGTGPDGEVDTLFDGVFLIRRLQ